MADVEAEPQNAFKIEFKRNQSHVDINQTHNSLNASFEWRKSKHMDFLFASRLIQDARDLRNFEYKKTQRHLGYYELFLRREFTWIMNFTFLVHVSLAFIERPTDLVDMPYWVPCLIELVCLLVYFIRWLHLWSFQTPSSFWSDKKNWVLLFTIIVSVSIGSTALFF